MVAVCDGHYDVTVVIRTLPSNGVKAISYAGIPRRELVPVVVEHYPHTEPSFEHIDDPSEPLMVSIGCSHRRSCLGREWDYTQEYEVLLFHVEFEDGRSIFKTMDVPPQEQPQPREVFLDIGEVAT